MVASCTCLSSSDALLYFHKGSGQQCTTEKQIEKYILYIYIYINFIKIKKLLLYTVY